MRYFVTVVTGLALVGVLAGPALAFQCPKLVKQITDATGNRFDNASYEGKAKAAAADKLHKEGKHADAEKAAKEGLKAIGMGS